MQYQTVILSLMLLLNLPAFADDAADDASTEVVTDLRGTLPSDESGTAGGSAAPAAYQSCAGTSDKPIRVVYNITRGIEKATVFEGSVQVRSYTVHGGRDALEHISGFGNFCSFSSVGEMKPTQLIIDKKSTEHDGAPMPFYVELDAARGIGAHQGSLNSHSGGCLRQSKADAMWLYGYVKSHSKIYGGNQIACSDVSFEVIDNSRVPNLEGKIVPVAEARAECFAKIGQPLPLRTVDNSVPPLPKARPVVSGEMLPADHFTKVVYDKNKDAETYKYMNEGFGADGTQKFPAN